MMALMVGVLVRAMTVLALVAGTVSCSSSGTVTDPSAAAGPVQDLHLDGGAQVMHWTGATGRLGVVAGLPGGTAGTGCFGWSDLDGTTHWAARVVGEADGHRVQLELAVDGQQVPPLGRHATIGSDGSDGMATLSVDGVAYRYAGPDPADTQGAYFILDNDGTTGLVWIRFAASPEGRQVWKVEGRWRCA